MRSAAQGQIQTEATCIKRPLQAKGAPADMIHMPASGVRSSYRYFPFGPCRLRGYQDCHLKPPRVVTSL